MQKDHWQSKYKYPELQRNKHFNRYYLRHYGITLDQVIAMKIKQDYKCAICLKRKKKLHVDHNHKTGKVRGLLCFTCNTAIGKLQVDKGVQLLQRAIAYAIEV